MLPQPVPVTGPPLSRRDQVRQAARARNTQRAYLGHWTRFHRWAQEQGLDLPEGLEAALCDYLVRLAEDGKRMATIRQARAAIIKGADLAGWPKPGGSGVAEMMRGLGRILRGPQRQAAPLHAEALAAIRATAFTRRRTRGGHTETAEYAQRRGLVDVALASVMRDGLLRVSEAAALRWGDVELAGDGSGRIRITESKTDQEAEGGGVVPGTSCRRSPAGRPPGRGGDRRGHSGLQPPPRHHPAASAAGSAGGWAPRLAGHHRTLWASWYGPGPVGCGVRPPRADDGGPVEVAADASPVHGAPDSRTGRGGQVLPGRQGVEARRRSPGKRAPARWSPFPVAESAVSCRRDQEST